MSKFLSGPITEISGVGEKKEKLLNKLGVYTVEDLISFFPYSYEDRTVFKLLSEAEDGERVCVSACVCSKVSIHKINKSLTIYSFKIKDDTGSATACFYNQKFTAKSLTMGRIYNFFGEFKRKGKLLELINPVYEEATDRILVGNIIPVYHLTTGINNKFIINVVKNVLKDNAFAIDDAISPFIRQKYCLCSYDYAIRNIHFPSDEHALKSAIKRLAFEELYTIQLALAYLRVKREVKTTVCIKNTDVADEFIYSLPYSLTNAQVKAINDILNGFKKQIAMNRLIQGDVGCGKTVVAAAAMYTVAKNGYQSVLMVPTEILAIQHYNSFMEFFKNTKLKICLLTGGLSLKNKKLTLNQISAGDADIIIGTHALIEDRVEFKNVGLVITDEQHRFGVKHRAFLESKGKTPHTIIMTATPIPRTLSLIIYGDLDISIIDELPPQRKKVDTFCINNSKKDRMYDFVKNNLKDGKQAYFVCPLVEESENSNGLKDVLKYAEYLKNDVFDEFSVGLIHGKLKSSEKDEIMNKFLHNEINVLVATTVIEVGVNVVNANIMVIENAERFGLSQLHQLRGRVGRGSDKSYCVLINNTNSETANKRMKIMCETNDGFKISEEDLNLRGPGEFFGTRQHGIPVSKIVSLCGDIKLIEETRKASEEVLKIDPNLKNTNNKYIKEKIEGMINNSYLTFN